MRNLKKNYSKNFTIDQTGHSRLLYKNVTFTLSKGRPDCIITQTAAKAAFTLAEVLITLAIIGVLAALTIPVISQHYVNRLTETRLAKFYSLINQAIIMSKVDNGEPETWDYWTTDTYDEDNNIVNQSEASDRGFQKYLAPYLKVTKKNVIDKSGDKKILYYFADGSAFSYVPHQNRDWIFYPYKAENCIKNIQQYGVCQFAFEFYPVNVSGMGTDDMWKYLLGKGLEPSLHKWNGDPKTLYSSSERGCKNGSGAYCTAIIQRNGWKIPKDYPRKIKY